MIQSSRFQAVSLYSSTAELEGENVQNIKEIMQQLFRKVESVPRYGNQNHHNNQIVPQPVSVLH